MGQQVPYHYSRGHLQLVPHHCTSEGLERDEERKEDRGRGIEGRAERVREGDRGMEGRACRGKKPGRDRLGLMVDGFASYIKSVCMWALL